MKLLLDEADVSKIAAALDYYAIDGVTTNPSILYKNHRPPYTVLKEIRSLIGPERELYAQVISEKAEGMVEEGKRIVEELGENTYIKVPAIKEGFKAIKLLNEAGYKTCATCIYTPMQAYLAAKNGAKKAAPYINRIDNLGYDGLKVTKEIIDIMDIYGYDCEVLGASFKNSNQVLALLEYGMPSATVAYDILENFVNNAEIDRTARRFNEDFALLCGENKTMKNI